MLSAVRFMTGTPIDRSGTTSAGASSQVAPAIENRKGFWFQNISDTEMWINEIGAASAGSPSIKIPPSALYEFSCVPITAINVFCTVGGKAYSARGW